MASQQVQELPLNNRNFVQLATLAPGVSSDLADEVGVGLASTVSISINGARRNAVNWLVDGVSNVDVGSNITLLSTPEPRVDRGVQDHHQRLPGRVAAQRRRHRQRRDQVGRVALRRQRLRVPAQRQAQRELVLPQSEHRSGDRTARRRSSSTTTSAAPSAARSIPSKMFFFFSEELRRINRAPASLNANVYDPAWLTDPTSANYVAAGAARSERGRSCWRCGRRRTSPAALQFLSSQPNINNTRQEVGARRLRLQPELAADRPLLARQQLHRGAGRPVPAIQVPNVATTDTNVPGQVAAAILRVEHRRRRR